MIRHASPSTSVLTLSIICPGVVDHAPHSTAPYGLTPLPLMRARTTPYEMAYGNTTHKPMLQQQQQQKQKRDRAAYVPHDKKAHLSMCGGREYSASSSIIPCPGSTSRSPIDKIRSCAKKSSRVLQLSQKWLVSDPRGGLTSVRAAIKTFLSCDQYKTCGFRCN